MACAGVLLEPTDATALHYRHLATQMARTMKSKSVEDVLLDRARGHVVSKFDPVGGGVHCSLGGGAHDFIVTSTLASQGPPAVGRAIGAGLARHLGVETPFPRNFVSFVSCGDGSVNNAHMLAAVNTAEYARFRSFKCPTVFCVTDNDICISLRGHGWLTKGWLKKLRMPLFECDGTNMADVWKTTAGECKQHDTPHCRCRCRPCALPPPHSPLQRAWQHTLDPPPHARTHPGLSGARVRPVMCGHLLIGPRGRARVCKC